MSGSFLLMVCPKTKRTLIGQRSADAEYSPNKWFSFGGTMEEGEDPACTAMRECFEETGITHDEYDISEQPIYTTQLPDHDGNPNDIHLYLGIINDEKTPLINNESKQYKWSKFGELADLDLHEVFNTFFTDRNAIDNLKYSILSYRG